MNTHILTKIEIANESRVRKLIKCQTITPEVRTAWKRYLKQRKDKNAFEVIYERSKNIFGRLMATPEGLQRMERNSRAYVSGQFYIDADIENCAPTILNWLLQKNQIPSPTFERYVAERANILEENKVTKQDVISMIFNRRPPRGNEFFLEMHKDVYEKLIPKLQEDETYKKVWQVVKKSRKAILKDNREGSFISNVAYLIEDEILMKMHAFIESESWNPDVLACDGLQIRRKDIVTLDESLLQRCSVYVLEKTTIKVNIREKPMVCDPEWLTKHGLELDEEDEDVDMDEVEKEKGELFLQPVFPDDSESDELAKAAIIERSDAAIARFVIDQWGYRFYVDGKTWYFFKEHTWVSDEDGHELTHILMSELYPLLDKQCSWRNPKKDEELCKALLELNVKVNSSGGCRNIREACRVYLAQKNTKEFLKRLDGNLYMLAFRNGVYDLKGHEFRRGMPDDHISMQINYDFVEYEKNHPVQVELRKIIKQILPDKEKRFYIMKFLSTCLAGCSLEETLILHGGGANGTSFLTALLEICLCVYATSWSTSILTQDFDVCSPNPELASGEKKRFINIQEGRKGKTLNMETLKKLTGGDFVRARKLFENGAKFILHALMVLSVNDLPMVTEMDRGTWRRIRLTDFTSTFSEDPNEINLEKHIYEKDGKLKLRHEEFAPHFMAMMIEYYKLYEEEGLDAPDSVLGETAAFRKSQNIYAQFVEEDVCDKWAAKNHINGAEKKGLKKHLETIPNVKYEESLRVVYQGKSKVSNGYHGITINSFQPDASAMDQSA
ncbi:hypothetical protein HK097_007366 [Rhizophlyctis rosea]|uniref:SF3 helicase domain-containing protein n=1 Tax=Rhizophlyctis rosea TaxID=64517 RepID=A0AAD5SBQ6_9FUNG|nr:hypothetical protein HK097_007366 [Rhizophlyctis rosea]